MVMLILPALAAILAKQGNLSQAGRMILAHMGFEATLKHYSLPTSAVLLDGQHRWHYWQ